MVSAEVVNWFPIGNSDGVGIRRHGLHLEVARYILLDISTRHIAPIYRLVENRRFT
jgi:hypothetical protein